MHGSSLFFLEREGPTRALLALAGARIDYRAIAAISPAARAVSALLLVLVLGAGVTVNGARRWLPVGGGFTIQPSELAKVALCASPPDALAGRRAAAARLARRHRPGRRRGRLLCGLV